MVGENENGPFRSKSLADVDPDSDPTPDEPSLLTRKQREYLAGQTNIESKSPDERSIRSRIRTRLKHLVRDMSRVMNGAEVRDIDQAFEEEDIINAWKSALALLLQRWVKFESSLRVDKDSPDKSLVDTLEDLIEGGITKAYKKRGQIIEEVNVDIDIEFGDKADEIEYDELEELSDEELSALYQSGRISLDQFWRAGFDSIN